MAHCYYDSPIGILKINANDIGISSVQLLSSMGKDEPNQIAIEAKNQLIQYFNKERKTFDLPLDPKGTVFEGKVWNHLLTIPYGNTTNYGTIARSISTIKAVRAVGRANGKNPIPIIIPCHRVVGKDKSLIGFALGIGVKQFLLNLENPDQWPIQTQLNL